MKLLLILALLVLLYVGYRNDAFSAATEQYAYEADALELGDATQPLKGLK